MPDIKIKGWSGTDFQDQNVPKIWLDAAQSTEEAPVLVPYTYGEAVSKTVEPDFSAGDMGVEIPYGELVTGLTITKPAELVPENIPNGMTIAGVGPGTFVDKTEECTVDLDMSDGDQVILPTNADVNMSKVIVKKPDTLIRENIAAGVTVAGIKGTHEGGGTGGELLDWVNNGCKEISERAYNGLASVRSVNFTGVTSVGNHAFVLCSNLEKADFYKVESFGDGAFYNAKALKTLIIRTQTMCTMTNPRSMFGYKIGADYRGPIALGTGYIYVPSALVDTYKADTKWSKFAAQFRAIEDYPDICG